MHMHLHATVFLAADHRGHALKETAEAYLTKRGVKVVDLTPRFSPDDDYPLVAKALAEEVLASKDARGLLACGSGAGIAIAANRFKGIRAAIGLGPTHVLAARHDDDLNVLVLAADFVDDGEVRGMLDAFVDAPFAKDEERFVRRIEELDQLGG